MRIFLAVCCFLLISVITHAQLSGRVTYFCSYYGGNAKLSQAEICMRYRSYENGISQHSKMERLLDTIMLEVGLPRNYLLVECPGIENCMAVNLQAQKGLLRYIVYDNAFMQYLDSSTNTYWATVSILAHEIGHHLSGHTLDSLGSRPDKELEADRFSGFILFKMGATLRQAQAAMEAIGQVNSVTTHPPLPNRLAAIRNGWNDGWSSNYRQQRNTNHLPVLKNWDDIAIELYDKAYLDNILGRYADAIRSANTAIYLKKDFAAAYCQRGLAEANTGETSAAILSLDSALRADGSFILAQVYKGRAYANAKRYAEAVREFNKALAMDSGCADIYAERALMRISQGSYDQAIDDGSLAIGLDYKDIHIPYGTIGYAYLQRKDYEEALYNFILSLRYNATYEYALKWGIEAEKKIAEKKAAEERRKKLLLKVKAPLKKTPNH